MTWHLQARLNPSKSQFMNIMLNQVENQGEGKSKDVAQFSIFLKK
jgi:hypothetical protein